MGKQRYLLLDPAPAQHLRIAEFEVDLANVRKSVNPGMERSISYPKIPIDISCSTILS
jgi:hypothetical protein